MVTLPPFLVHKNYMADKLITLAVRTQRMCLKKKVRGETNIVITIKQIIIRFPSVKHTYIFG